MGLLSPAYAEPQGNECQLIIFYTIKCHKIRKGQLSLQGVGWDLPILAEYVQARASLSDRPVRETIKAKETIKEARLHCREAK
jgi:hypothetical protein